MLYSKSTNGFYDREIHGSNVPNDVVEITTAQYVALFDGQTNGKLIGPGDDGYPTLFERQPATNEQLAAAAREHRNTLLAQSDWTQVADTPFTTEQRVAWVVYRQHLRDVPNQPNFPSTITWPEKP